MKWTFILIGTLSLCISLYWGISGQQWLEPWTAVLSAVLFLLGIFFPSSNSHTNSIAGRSVLQLNLFSFLNSSKAKRMLGKIRQLNIFGIWNKQEIE